MDLLEVHCNILCIPMTSMGQPRQHGVPICLYQHKRHPKSYGFHKTLLIHRNSPISYVDPETHLYRPVSPPTCVHPRSTRILDTAGASRIRPGYSQYGRQYCFSYTSTKYSTTRPNSAISWSRLAQIMGKLICLAISQMLGQI
jgi:hypothetical protein